MRSVEQLEEIRLRLAAGYYDRPEAIEVLAGDLVNRGVVVGERHALEARRRWGRCDKEAPGPLAD